MLAQAVGRFGNWFNQELYGRPTTLPWALEIDGSTAGPSCSTSRPTTRRSSTRRCGTSASPRVLLWADRRWRLGGGRVFALYLALYAVGRMWIEALRIDDANTFFGVRLNVFVMGVVLVGSVIYLVRRRARGPRGRSSSAAPEPAAGRTLLGADTTRPTSPSERPSTTTATGTSPAAGCARPCSASWTGW